MTRLRVLAPLLAALALLNASLTFENLWPTPAILPGPALSFELAALLLLFGAAAGRLGRLPPAALRIVAVVWLLLVVGRYVQVTAPALYGREINLYWDLQYIPDVIALSVKVAPVWLVMATILAIVLIVVGLYSVLLWALRRVATAVGSPEARGRLAALAAAVMLAFAVQSLSARLPQVVATPVSEIYARQFALVAETLTGSHTVPDSPPMATTLGAVAGADVFLVFVEAYGAVSFDRPSFAEPLVASRAALTRDIRDTGRDVVSAFVESPTFGGSSWLAHISLLTGVEVRDQLTNARMMAQQRDTLVQVFQTHGYRTLALMPGLRQPWPEGAFYRFNDIYGATRLAYRGPQFGFFAVPDQFTLERIDTLEMQRPRRAPLFVFFPTISTHFPFSPTPPYQPDWSRITDERPFDGPELTQAFEEQLDWEDFRPAYVNALSYDYASLGGFLRRETGRDLVMILIGDHQPAAVVSGEGAPWDVPVHIVSNRRELLDRLTERGFGPGLTPARPRLTSMAGLLPILLDAFGGE